MWNKRFDRMKRAKLDREVKARISRELKKMLRDEAAREDLRETDIIRRALRWYLDKQRAPLS